MFETKPASPIPRRFHHGPPLWALPLGFLLALAIVLPWALQRSAFERADLCVGNGPEPRSLDPAAASAAAESRTVGYLFEGLTIPDAKSLAPTPGLAASWVVSDDGRTVTFTLRPDLCFSDGHMLRADDVVWSLRRVIDPLTASEVAPLLWCVEGAEETTRQVAILGEQIAVRRVDGTTIEGRLVARDDRETTLERSDGRRDTVPAVEIVSIGPAWHRVGITASGDRTVTFRLREPTPWIVDLLGFAPLGIVPRHAIERHGRSWTEAGKLVSSGPFVLERRRLRDRIRLRRNPLYWDASNVALETVDLLTSDSYATLLNLYVHGEVDWITDVPLSAIPELLLRHGPRGDGQFRPSPFFGTYFFRVNTLRDPLGDVDVRIALSLAVDRDALVASVTGCEEPAARSLVPPLLETYRPPRVVRHDVVAAKAALARAAARRGGRPFPTIELLFNSNDLHQRVAELIQHHWRTVLGLDVRLISMEFGALKAAVRRGEYGIARASWLGDHPDATSFLDVFQSGSPSNQTGFADEMYDRWVGSDARRSLDPQERAQILARAETRLLESGAVIPLFHYVTRNLVSPRVGGFFPTLLDHHPPKALFMKLPEPR